MYSLLKCLIGIFLSFILSQLATTCSFGREEFSPLAVYMWEACRSKGSYGRENKRRIKEI